MFILTHRGLDPSKDKYFAESTLEAFADQINRGFGLEFDLQMTKDDQIVILHDNNLSRISEGKDDRLIRDLDLSEIKRMDFRGCRLASLNELLSLISRVEDERLFAIHIKFGFQKIEYLNILLKEIVGIDQDKFIFFDLKIDSAQYLKSKNNLIQLAASVSHPFDIERYNTFTGGTLIPLSDILNNKNLFEWAWLDEWDRIDKNMGSKKMYTLENFNILREYNFKIALVTPELHRGSPGLLAKEIHEDAESQEKLFSRISEILKLGPDAVCTDYPDNLRSMSLSS